MRNKFYLLFIFCFLLIQAQSNESAYPSDDEDSDGSGDGEISFDNRSGPWPTSSTRTDYRLNENIPSTKWPNYSLPPRPTSAKVFNEDSFDRDRDRGRNFGLDPIFIRVYPTSQIIYTTQEVVIRCRDEGINRLPVIWDRADGRPLSPEAIEKSGRLVIPNIKMSDAGLYKCSPSDQNYRYLYSNTSTVIVYPIENLQPTFPKEEYDEFQCRGDSRACPETKNCIPMNFFCDGVKDCLGGGDEDNCEACKFYHFRCKNGQCIAKARQCDLVTDCRDGSDEIDCNNNERGIVGPLQLSITPQYLDVEKGAFVQFACTSSDPNARLGWVFERGDLPRTATVLGGNLNIRNAQEMDQGTYICMATDSYGGKAEAQAKLTVRRPQSFVSVNVVPSYIEVHENGNVLLTCNSSVLVNNYEWKFNRGALPSGVVSVNNQLRIYRANQRHSGHYQCVISTPYGPGESAALVTINTNSGERRPAMIVHPSHSEIPISGTARFLCNATDPRPSQTIWSFKRGGLPPGAIQSRELLVISPVKEEHYGEYVCTVSNSYGHSQQTVELRRLASDNSPLDVPSLPGPKIDIQPAEGTNAELGAYVRFECISNEVEPDELRWSNSLGTLPVGAVLDRGVLTLGPISEVHYGVYSCVASNSYGTNRKSVELRRKPAVDVPYMPYPGQIDLRIEPQMQTIVQGNSGILRCVITGAPNTPIIWEKINGMLTERHRIEGEIMRIEDAVINDRGLYVCKIESSPGTVIAQGSAIVEIEPRESPAVEIYPGTIQTVKIGRSTFFQCRIIAGIPEPKLTWSRADNLPFTRNTNVDDPAVIKFNQITGNEEGKYKCTAENIAGRVESEVTLRIERSEPSMGPVPSDPMRPPYSARPSDNPMNPYGPSYPPQTSSSGISIKINQKSPLVIKEGDHLLLDCMIEGSTDAQVIWMSVPKNKYITETSPQRTVYQKYTATPDDSGEYRCIARTTTGTLEGRIKVIVGSTSGVHHSPSQQVSPMTPYESIRNVTLRVGGFTELKCHASGPGLTSPVMMWSREAGELPSNAYVREGVLYINKITEDNSGTYTCTGRGANGEVVAIQRVLLNVQSRLSLTLDPVSQVVTEGSPVAISCVAEGAGTDQVQVTWNREGAVMSPMTRTIGGQLIFTKISQSDTGSYICRGLSPIGEARAVAHVQVGSPASSSATHHPHPAPAPTPTYPTYPSRLVPNFEPRQPEGKREIVDLYSTKTLSCDFEYIPGHTTKWEFNNARTLPPNASPYGDNIVLTNIDKNNEGRYVCNAQMPGSERTVARNFFDVTVREPDSCTPYEFRCYDATCIERERRCDGRADCPDGSDEQYCPDGRQSYPRQPDIRSRYPTDPRQNYPSPQQPYPYPSYADPRQQTVQVDVKITASNMLVTAGQDLELRCHADGPDYRYEWLKGIHPVQGDNIQINHNILTIKEVRPENGGVYTCRARSRFTYGTDDHVVMIQRASHSQALSKVEADVGSSVGLSCPVNVPDAVYTWSRPNQPLPKNIEILNERLVIHNVKPNYTGTYECVAKGSQGSSISSVLLDVKKVIPRFRREYNSHIKLPTIPDAEKAFDVEIAIKPDFGEGLILYNAEPFNPMNNKRNFVSLALTRGFVEYRIQSGSSDIVSIRSSKPLNMREWTKIVIQKDGPNVLLIINDVAEPPKTLKADNIDLKLSEPLFIGGIPRTGEIYQEVALTESFIGCMSVLKVKDRSIIMADEGELTGITACATCLPEVCSGHGACHEDAAVTPGFQCICHPGFSGRNCSANIDACNENSCGVGRCVNLAEGGYDCYCPFGKSGHHCERNITIKRPSFGGKSYAAYPRPVESVPEKSKEPESRPQQRQLKVQMVVKPSPDKEGLLMYSGQDATGKNDFAAVTIRDRAIEFAFDTGSGPAFIRSAPLESFDDFVTFEVKTSENNGILTINGKEYSETAPGPAKSLKLETPMYIGGFDQQKIKLPRSLNVSHGFEGCIAHVEINEVSIDFANQVLDAANVDDCGSHDSCTEPNQQCQNGGTCQAESCVCPPTFTGHRCETKISSIGTTTTPGTTPTEKSDATTKPTEAV